MAVDFATMQDAVDQLQAAAGRLQQLLQDHLARQAPLFASWAGSASDQHQTTHQQWMQNATGMQELISGTSSVLQTVHQNFLGTEGTNTKMWS
jgi:WXG100 family type VII secretion target